MAPHSPHHEVVEVRGAGGETVVVELVDRGVAASTLASSATRMPPISAAAADACIAAASEEPFPEFVAPSGSPDFRAAFAEHVRDLRCCVSPGRARDLDARVVGRFVPREDGRATAHPVPADDRPRHEARCIAGVMERWWIPRAPVSDVVHDGADAHGGSTTAASVAFSVPLYDASK